MVHHMDREELMVKRSQRRTQGNPQCKHPIHESGKLPSRNQVWNRTPQTQPTSQVDPCRKKQGKRNWGGDGPWFERGLDCRCHGRLEGRTAEEFSPLPPNAMAREASRAGACPAGCSV